MTRPELRAAVAAKVIQIDPVGADARHAKAAQDREVNFAARPDGTADCFAHGPADVIWGLRNWLYPAAAAAKTPDDERTADQRRFDVFADLLDEAIRRAAHQEEEQDPGCGGGCDCDSSEPRPERIQHPAGTAPNETDPTGTAPHEAASAGADPTGTASYEAASAGADPTATAPYEAGSTGTASTGTASTGTASTGTASTGTASTGAVDAVTASSPTGTDSSDADSTSGEASQPHGTAVAPSFWGATAMDRDIDGTDCDGAGTDRGAAGTVETEREGAPPTGTEATRPRRHPTPKRAPHSYRGGLHAQLHVVVPATSLIDTGPDQPDPPAMLTGYGPIPPALARAIAADAAWRRLVTDPFTGRLVDYGTTRYRPPQYLEEFVTARDQTCTAMGCRLPARRCDTDHEVPFPQGPTNEANLGKKCRWHHRCKTHGGWSTSFDSDTGTVVWTSPLGKVYEAPRVPLTTPLPRSPVSADIYSASTTTSTEKDDDEEILGNRNRNRSRGNADLAARRTWTTGVAEDTTIGEHDERRSSHGCGGDDEKPPF